MKIKKLLGILVLFGIVLNAQAYCSINDGSPHIVGSFQLSCSGQHLQKIGGIYVLSANCDNGHGGKHFSYLSNVCMPNNMSRDISNALGTLVFAQFDKK